MHRPSDLPVLVIDSSGLLALRLACTDAPPLEHRFVAMWKPGGHHQRAVRYCLIVGNGTATTPALLAWCYPRAAGKYQHSRRWAMIRAARRFARSIGYGKWQATGSLMARIKGIG